MTVPVYQWQPSSAEIAHCRPWLETEVRLLRPALILPVGRLAISQFLSVTRLTDAIGNRHRVRVHGGETDLIPLPHPSGASTWHRREPGKGLLQQALQIIQQHPAWEAICQISH